jgi:PPK2 family polyphosphate:nucleotide phosphotransferase
MEHPSDLSKKEYLLPPKKITKAQALERNIKLLEKLSSIQEKLFAQRKYSVLIILQGMDTAGKDSAVKHVFSGVNPAGCNVKSFKVPTEEEAAHHFLWRVSKECPARGMIEIFNRSHYEELLVPMVNKLLNDNELKERCEEINNFEKGLINNRTILIKFYLNISHIEQLQRLKERQSDKTKRWKYQKGDEVDIKRHDQFKDAYAYVLKHCSDVVPWHIIPADKKWYKNYLILNTIVKELSKYKIHYPASSPAGD